MIGRQFKMLPEVVKNLIIINVLFFFAAMVLAQSNWDLQALFSLKYPGGKGFKPFQIVTHMFTHGSIGHLFFNMFGVWVFGSMLERYWGSGRFLMYFLACGLGAAAIWIAVNVFQVYQATGLISPSIEILRESPAAASAYFSTVVGSSGALYGLLMAAFMTFPEVELNLIFPPIKVKMKYLVLFLLIYDFVLGRQSVINTGIAHFAHLGGLIFGFILMEYWRRNPR